MDINIQDITNFTFYVSLLSAEAADEILNKVDVGIIHSLKLTNENLRSYIIKEGTKLFTDKPLLEDSDNINKNIKVESGVRTIEGLDTFKKEENNYFANSDGWLVKDDKKVKFIPVNYDGFCEIEVSEDKKTATANFYPAEESGKLLTNNDVIKFITEKNILAKLDKFEIDRAVGFVNKNCEVISNIVIAKGESPKPGQEAWVEYLFDTEPKTETAIDEYGNTDFHSRNLLESVTQNQTIAVFHPMVEGEPGMDVFGEKIFPPKLKVVKPPSGNKIYYSEKKPTHILSKIDGYISLVKGKIVITNLYNIKGDVDFHTGHIVSKGSVNVLGNVISGFNLDMSETIKINGYVKDSNIKAGGDISINGGFNGTGYGTITSGGNVSVRYIRNQTIYSRGNISVEKEVVEAKLFAKGDIKSKNNQTILMGGHAIAGGDLIVNRLGHEYGMTTIIEVGYDYEILDKIKSINRTIDELNNELIQLKMKIDANMMDSYIATRQQKLAKVLLLKYQMVKKNQDILINKKNQFANKITSFSGSKVIVSGKIYPGVNIKIDGYNFDVKEMLQSKTFMVSEEEEEIIVVAKV